MGAQIPTLYLLLAAVIGIFIGLLVASLFTTREPRSKQEPPREAVKEGFGEVARLWYSPAGKRLMVEMEGGQYKEFTSLSKEQQAKVVRLADLLNDWVVEPVETAETFVEEAPREVPQMYVPIVPDGQDEPEEPYQPVYREPDFAFDLVEEEPALKVEEPITPFASADQEEADLVSALQESLNEEMESPEDEEPSVKVDEPITPFVSAEQEEADLVSVLQESLDEEMETPEDEEPAITPDLSITQQISAILDEMLAGTELQDKGIRLWENEDHGVDVWVGVEKFEGIEAVPYPQVRQVIRDAVLRWEKETESQQRSND